MTAGKLLMRAGKRALFHPQDLSASVLVAWWCADDHGTARMTDDGSGLISNWIDRIGGMAVTATTTARPTWTGNAFNSAYAGLTFDGVANCFVSTSLTTLPTGSTPGEVWISALAMSDAGNTDFAFAYGGTAAGTSRQLRKGVTDLQNASDGSTTANGQSFVTSPGHILSASFSGTTMNAFSDGTPFSANPATIATLATGTTRLRIGATIGTTAGNFFPGVIRHAMILQGTLSTALRQKLEGWLAWDAGMQSILPVSHPYRLFRP